MNKKLLDLLEKDFKGGKGVIRSISDPIPTPTAYLKCNRNTRVTVNADTEFNYYYNRLVADSANFASPIKIDQSAIAIDAFYAANKTSFPAKEAALLEVSNGDEYVDIVFDPAEPVWVGPLHLEVIRKVRTAYDHLVMGKYPIVSIKSRMTSPDTDGHIKHQYQYGQTQYDQCARDLYFSSGYNERVGTLGEPLVLGTDNSIVIDPAVDPANIAMVPRLLINNPSTAEFYTATSKHTVYHWLSYTGHADNEVMTIDLGGDFNTFIYLDHVNNGVYIQPDSTKIYINAVTVDGIVQGRAILLALELRMSSGTDYEAGIWINGVYIGAAPLGVVVASDWLSYTISGASSAPAQLRFDYLTVLDKALTDAEHLALYRSGKIPVAALSFYDYADSLQPLVALFADRVTFNDAANALDTYHRVADTVLNAVSEGHSGDVTLTLSGYNVEWLATHGVMVRAEPLLGIANRTFSHPDGDELTYSITHSTPDYFTTHDFTVGFWVLYPYRPVGRTYMADVGNGSISWSDGSNSVHIRGTGATGTATGLNRGKPVFIAVTYRLVNAAWVCEAWINGNMAVSGAPKSIMGDPYTPPTNTIDFKFWGTTDDEPFIDGILFFDRALTPEEHLELASPKYVNDDRLYDTLTVGWW